MKIGIITYYDVVNYGAVLLAYAMNKKINSMGHEVVFLRYDRENKQLQPNKSLYWKLRGLTPNAIKARESEKEKTEKFEEFKERFLKIGDYYNIDQGLDLIVVGSDQIFDCKHEFNDFQYAIHAACDHIISYAPSFGEFCMEDLKKFDKRNELQIALKQFDAHSARDDNTAKLLKVLTGKQPIRVLDPTLLYDFKEEKIMWNERLVSGEYLIVYAWGGTTNSLEFRESVTAFARNNGLKTVTVGDRRPWCDIDFSAASPIEFFELYKHCAMVITNMFHGTCFSIINEKPFYSVLMQHNKNKLSDLLEFFNLGEQKVSNILTINNNMVPKIDYSGVHKHLEQQRAISTRYIYSAIL